MTTIYSPKTVPILFCFFFRASNGTYLLCYDVTMTFLHRCSYVDKRSMPIASTQGESEEQTVVLSLNVIAGGCRCYNIV